MKLSIITINYNTQPLTESLITSLLADPTLPRGIEIIVVDNNSQDDSVAFLRSDFPEVTVLDNKENVGLAAGVNRGIRQARGQYYLILNPDIIALPGSVAKLVQFMDDNDDVGIAGGKLISPNGRLQYSCYRFYRPSTIVYRRTFLGKSRAGKHETSRFLMKDYNHQRVQDVEWLMGACLIVRRKAVGNLENWRRHTPLRDRSEGIGGMDERYFLYFEDVDWCRRMWEAGWRVSYVPEAVFSHFHQRSSERGSWLGMMTNQATKAHIVSAFRYFWKFRGRPLPQLPLA